MNKSRKLILMGHGAAVLALTDGFIKHLVDSGKIKDGRLGSCGCLEIEKHHNKGFAMNRLDDRPELIKAASCFMIGAHTALTVSNALDGDNPVADAANTFILAGAISNTYDRIKRGYVTDYIKVGRKKRVIYNLSDFLIIGGTALSLAGNIAAALISAVRKK